jgi:uncharacterized protein YjlB
MDKLEPIKRLAERATGVGFPSQDEALVRIVKRTPRKLKFRSDGYIPNSKRPLLIYRNAVRFTDGDPAALIEAIFEANGWDEGWRNGVYFYVHYHSRIHEVLGVAKGSATLRLGGNKGTTVEVQAGDVIVVPAGVGHECLAASESFLVVGAYPPTGTYDECRGSFAEYQAARKSVTKVPVPKKDPLYGAEGGLRTIW